MSEGPTEEASTRAVVQNGMEVEGANIAHGCCSRQSGRGRNDDAGNKLVLDEDEDVVNETRGSPRGAASLACISAVAVLEAGKEEPNNVTKTIRERC